MNTITITVKSVNIVKTGVRQDKEDGHDIPWTMINVIDENDKKYTTFDESYLKSIGKTITINYEETESGSNPKNNGNPYKNRNIVAPKKGQSTTQNSTQAWAEKLVAKVKEMETRIGELETFTGIHKEPERPSLADDEINPVDIPF
jgi:hypothetical protein